MGAPPWLVKLYVFDLKYGKREEDQHEKVLFYYPASADQGLKQRDVGLSEAIINFTKTFSKETPCEVVHTEKCHYIYYECEPGAWFVLAAKSQAPRPKEEKRAADGREFAEDAANDEVLKNITRQAYRFFRFFSGTMSSIGEKEGREGLQRRLEDFLNPYLLSLHVDTTDFCSSYSGLKYFPVDRVTYLNMQSFINATESTFQSVRVGMLMLDDSLLWSGCEMEEMRVLYNYMTLHVIRLSDEAQKARMTQRTPPDGELDLFGFSRRPFIVSLEHQSPIESTATQMPVVHRGQDCSIHEHLFVMQYGHVWIVLLVDQAKNPTVDPTLLKNTVNYVRPHAKAMQTVLGEQQVRAAQQEDPYRYIYYNQINSALKSSLKTRGIAPGKETASALADIQQDLHGKEREAKEVCVRTAADTWVVGRHANDREFAAVFDLKNANLVDINDELSKLCASTFHNIFLE